MALKLLSHKSVDFDLKDNEGFTFLEMLQASLKLPKLEECQETNRLQLDSEDDDKELDISDTEPMIDFQKHSSSDTLWTWGSNNNYLLGHGDSDSRSYPEQIYIPISKADSLSFDELLDQDPVIVQIVMSKYHVALLTHTQLFTFGFGIGGRLGHGNESTMFKPTPVRGIAGRVSFVACGYDHTLVISETGELWSWGSNKHFQLGYPTDGENQLTPFQISLKKCYPIGIAASKFHSAVFTANGAVYTWGTNNGQLGYQQATQPTPRKVTAFPTQMIKQIVATNESTAVLVESNEVYVFASYTIKRINFPQPLYRTFSRFSSKKHGLKPFKIFSGPHELACVMSSGDIYMWNATERDPSLIVSATNIRKVWSVRRKQFAAVNCAIGVDSSLLVCTENGYAYLGERKCNSIEKTHSPYQPKTNSKTDFFKIEKDQSPYKYSRLSNLEHIELVSASSSGSYAAVRSDFRCPQKITRVEPISSFLSAGLEPSRKDFDLKIISAEGEVMYAHCCMFLLRSEWFRAAFSHPSHVRSTDYSLDVSNHLKVLQFFYITKRPLELLISFIYTGDFEKPWSIHYSVDRNDNSVQSKIYNQFTYLVKLLKLNETEILQCYFKSASLSLNQQVLENFPGVANVAIQLSDRITYGHSLFLSTRVPFFSVLVGHESRWSRSSFESGHPLINLSHISYDVFRAIEIWSIDGDTNVFSSQQFEDVTRWLLYIRSVLIAADELLVPAIVSVCSVVLARFITIRNAFDLLGLADSHNAVELKLASLDFVIRNIETFLKDGSLYTLSEDLLGLVQSHLRYLQICKLPLMLGSGGYYDSLAKQSKINARNSFNWKSAYTSSYETLVGGSFQSFASIPSPASVSTKLSCSVNMSPLLMPLNINISMSPVIMPDQRIDDEIFPFELDSSNRTSPQSHTELCWMISPQDKKKRYGLCL
ncbi:regulator of chromosome condensation 1/beta-lactamase-inhibitor protein II [Globomyces pollinis-pini]|nr:regulator of chromosome condensation 1/beta-lactamase-inhibitor protein II [Globomyces pollinis-pini]